MDVSRPRKRVWVGESQLSEYRESISVHDEVSWRVSRSTEDAFEGFLVNAPSVDCELNRYAWLSGSPEVDLVGRVAEIRAVTSFRSWMSSLQGQPLPPAIVSEPLYSTHAAMARGSGEFAAAIDDRDDVREMLAGFVVDVILRTPSAELDALT